MVLVKVAMRLMVTAWVIFLAFIAIPGAPGWLSTLSMAIFSIALWDLLVAMGFYVRGAVQDELARQRGRQAELERAEAEMAALRVRDRAAHSHEMSAAKVTGYLMNVGLVQDRVVANLVITIPAGSTCGLCTARAREFHDYGAY